MARHLATAALAFGLGLGLVCARAPAAEVLTASMVLDANSGAVLQAANPDAPRHPASLTKMMTLYLVFQEIEQGRLSFESKITVSEHAASVAPSKLDLKAGEEIALLDAIKALVTKSANDMAVAVAERVGGTEYGFVRLMNEKAREIGMRSTTFTNASGLPDDRQITTARDLLTLALRLQDDFPKEYGLFSLKAFTYRGKTYRTHNTLLLGFPGMDGIKTGYTRSSGFNLVSSVRIDGKHIVAVVLGGSTAAARNAHMRVLLYRALKQASTQKARRPQAVLVARNDTAAPPPAPMAAPPPPTQVSRPPAAAAPPAAPASAAAAAPPPQKAPPALRTTITDTPAAPPPAAPPPAPVTASSSPDIDIAKVRIVTPDYDGKSQSAPFRPQSISVAPPGAQGAGDADSDTAETTAAAPLPKLDLQALRAEISKESQTAEGAPAAPPSSIDDLIASEAPAAPANPAETGSAREEPVALVGEPAAPTATAETPGAPDSAPGRPGSSLDAQAAALAARSSPAPARVAAAGSGGGYEIQIGAYSSAAEAESRLSAARGLAPSVLDGRPSVALPVQSGGRQVFRARFASFDQPSAAAACAELKKRSLDCIVMRAD